MAVDTRPQKDCVLNLPRPITKTPWASHTKVLEKAARELLDKKLSNAAKEVRDFKFSSGLITLGNDERLEDKIINVGVSIDGSWSSRGWTARDGVVAAVSIDTGKVLDVVYLYPTLARRVSEKKEGTISTRDYLEWYTKIIVS